MGSRGTGKFTDYSGMASSGNLGNGGRDNTDICDKEINCSLEEVGNCGFFLVNRDVPAIGTKVELFFDGSRICARTLSGGDVLGYLPTSYNYVLLCINQGKNFTGGVSNSRKGPLPYVTISVKA